MWACWDGGGNLTPNLGIARVLEDREHEVHFFELGTSGLKVKIERLFGAGWYSLVLVSIGICADQCKPLSSGVGPFVRQTVGRAAGRRSLRRRELSWPGPPEAGAVRAVVPPFGR